MKAVIEASDEGCVELHDTELLADDLSDAESDMMPDDDEEEEDGDGEADVITPLLFVIDTAIGDRCGGGGGAGRLETQPPL